MLTQRRHWWAPLILAVLVASFSGGTRTAEADSGKGGATCPGGTDQYGNCIVQITIPGQEGGGGGGDGSTGGSGSAGDGDRKCYGQQHQKVPCHLDGGVWNPQYQCYISPADPPPPANDPAWAGHYPDGGVYACSLGGGTGIQMVWLPTPPQGVPAPPNPAQLAQQAIAKMALRAIAIGIVPEDKPGRVGTIGLPTWMWVTDPDEHTIGPITRTASAAGYTVTATAKASKVVWDMGDGSSVTCSGPGTPYTDADGKSDSPTCGHTYTKKGRYKVSATSYWEVDWRGIGQQGVINLHFTRNTHIVMGEVQVVGRR